MSGRIGSCFDAFLVEERLYERSVEIAFQRVLAFRLRQLMREFRCSSQQLASRLSLPAQLVEWCLDPHRFPLEGPVLRLIAGRFRLSDFPESPEDRALVKLSSMLPGPVSLAAEGQPGTWHERQFLDGIGQVL